MLLPGVMDLDIHAVLAHFHEHGWARLGPVMSPEFLAQLQQRTDDLMLGRVTYPGLFFQHDSMTGAYEDLKLKEGYTGPSLHYRKLEKLEKDPLFAAWMRNPLFERVATTAIGTDVMLYRAVIFNKAAHGGTHLPWHQDGGTFWGLTGGTPFLQIWTALDDASPESGCLELVPGTHLGGLVTPLGGVVPANFTGPGKAEERAMQLPAKAGESLLIHNHAWHRSGVNTTAAPRRGLTLCLMGTHIRCARKKGYPREFVKVFDAARG